MGFFSRFFPVSSAPHLVAGRRLFGDSRANNSATALDVPAARPIIRRRRAHRPHPAQLSIDTLALNSDPLSSSETTGEDLGARRLRRRSLLARASRSTSSRRVAALGVATMMVFLVGADRPQNTLDAWGALRGTSVAFTDRAFFAKEVRVTGLVHLASAEVSARLPWERSWSSWWLDRTDIAASFASDPLIASASRLSICQRSMK